MGKEQDLLSATKNGDYSQVKKLLAKLKKSAKNDHADDGKVKKSKSQSAIKKSSKLLNVNATDSDGFTALHHAALAEKPEICRDLLEVDANVAARDKNGMSPLHLAAWAGRVEQSRLLLRSGADPNALSSSGETALLLAAQYGKTDVASVLLQHKADVGIVGGARMTALDKACQFGHLEMVQLLVQAGALDHFKPLSAAERGDPNRHTPLHLAAKHGHLDIIKALLSSRMDVNLETANGTALHEAALYGRYDIVKFLVDSGVDVNVHNSFQQTALDIVQHFVKSAAAAEMKKILLESGCLNLVLAQASLSYQSPQSESLSFRVGDTIVVLEQNPSGMWKGSIGEGENKRTGFFPKAAVSVIKRPMSTASVAAIATQGGKTDAVADLPVDDYVYDVLQPRKMSDMPSPPLPVNKVAESQEPHQYGLLGQNAKGGVKPLVKDGPFSGKYTFDEASPKQSKRSLQLVEPYEEVSLKDVAQRKGPGQINYLQMQFPTPVDDVIHQAHPKTSYADVVVPKPLRPSTSSSEGREEEGENSKRYSRSSSTSHVRKSAEYENVDFERRSASVSKPKPIPPTRKTPAGVVRQRYENIVLPSEIGKLSSPAQSFDQDDDGNNVYEVMGPGTRKSPSVATPVVSSGNAADDDDDSEDYMSMNPAAKHLKPRDRSSSKRSSDASDSAYELMVLNPGSYQGVVSPGTEEKIYPDRSQEAVNIREKDSPRSPPAAAGERASRRMSIQLSRTVQAISDWCSAIRLVEYADVFREAGFDDTTFLVGVTDEILSQIGISKVGHRKKILALIPDTVAPLAALPREKPVAVEAWLEALGLSTYINQFVSQGYDDIEFVCDMTPDDLKEIGITKLGHVHKLLRGVKWLADIETQHQESGRDAPVAPVTGPDAKSDPKSAEQTRPTKHAPPRKPVRPSTGPLSPPIIAETTKTMNETSPSPPPPPPPPVDEEIDGSGPSARAPAPPRRHDSFKKTRDRYDQLKRGEAVESTVPEEEAPRKGAQAPPPPPPARGDSLRRDTERTPTPPLPPPPEPFAFEVEPQKKGVGAPPPVAPKPSVKPKPPVTAPKPPATAPKPKLAKKPPPAVPSKPAKPAKPAVKVEEFEEALPPPPPPAAVEGEAEFYPLPPPDVVPGKDVDNDAELPPPPASDFTLEDAIKQALRSPNLSRKENNRDDSPAAHAARTTSDSDDLKYEPISSDSLMNDIDHMLEDLNRELDELIPGM